MPSGTEIEGTSLTFWLPNVRACKKWQVLKTLTKKIISSKILGLKAFSKPPSPMNVPCMPYVVHITNKYPRVQRCMQYLVQYISGDNLQELLRLEVLEEFGGVLRSLVRFWDVSKKTHYGPTDWPTDGPMDQQTNRLTDWRIDRPIDGQTLIKRCVDTSKKVQLTTGSCQVWKTPS